MITEQQLDQAIDNWSINPELKSCCKKIAYNVLKNQDKNKSYTYFDFAQVIDSEDDGLKGLEKTQQCINLLKSSPLKLIRQVYRYIDDDVIYDLPIEDLQAAYQDGALNLEWRGYPDRNFESKVYVVFVANNAVDSK